MSDVLQTPGFSADLHTIEKLVRTSGKEDGEIWQEGGDEYLAALDRRYQEQSWVFLAFPGIAARIIQGIREARRGLFRGCAEYDQSRLNELRELLVLWVRLGDPVRQRAEFFGRHLKSVKEVRWLLGLLPDMTAQVKLVLAEWADQAASLSPALRVRPIPAGGAAKGPPVQA